MAPSIPEWDASPGFIFPKDVLSQIKDTINNPSFFHKSYVGLGTKTTMNMTYLQWLGPGDPIDMKPDSHLTQPVLPSWQILIFTTVNKTTYVAVLQNVLEVEKQTNKRRPSNQQSTR